MRATRFLFLAAVAIGLSDLAKAPAFAADLVLAPSQVIVVDAAPLYLKPPRRYLTTYMAKYPFGLLREDYTPLGAPGVSKAAYFGRPMRTATLHVSPRRAWRSDRVVLRTRY